MALRDCLSPGTVNNSSDETQLAAWWHVSLLLRIKTDFAVYRSEKTSTEVSWSELTSLPVWPPLIRLNENFKYKAHALTVVTLHHSPLRNLKNIYSPLYSCSLKFNSMPQINWLCRWRRRALLSAKCRIEQLGGAASHQSSTNYAGYPRSIERSSARCEGGGGVLGSYQFKLWLNSEWGPSVRPTLLMRKCFVQHQLDLWVIWSIGYSTDLRGYM